LTQAFGYAAKRPQVALRLGERCDVKYRFVFVMGSLQPAA
jgi:hypothetical protein